MLGPPGRRVVWSRVPRLTDGCRAVMLEPGVLEANDVSAYCATVLIGRASCGENVVATHAQQALPRPSPASRRAKTAAVAAAASRLRAVRGVPRRPLLPWTRRGLRSRPHRHFQLPSQPTLARRWNLGFRPQSLVLAMLSLNTSSTLAWIRGGSDLVFATGYHRPTCAVVILQEAIFVAYFTTLISPSPAAIRFPDAGSNHASE